MGTCEEMGLGIVSLDRRNEGSSTGEDVLP